MTVRFNFAAYDSMTTAISNSLDNNGSGPDNRIEIYSGDMPASAEDWFPGYGGSPGAGSPLVQLLVTFSNFKIDKATTADDVQAVIFFPLYSPNPNPVNATATGTASWYAMYDSGGSNGPIIGDVSATGGTGTLQLNSVSLTSGGSVTITHWGFRLQS